ncbi:hypothetical protein BLL36_08525 [Pseudomonas cedrina subsp. cedrina]|uniref:Uncharacterized protein n=1 Tax=Pseudomonas cedrina subsp. cedrina TaxID=76762 RepID=A0A1V2KB96_PSECE|nr:hypothetical protein BLL36_08525 [Pseudomonas cedrina subsp. cedrina]
MRLVTEVSSPAASFSRFRGEVKLAVMFGSDDGIMAELKSLYRHSSQTSRLTKKNLEAFLLQ